ncbi:MAG: OsmC family protein [Betaproteobacteria bacterium]|nr:OsmC family protein [Betaproteobacteria bacterium]
MTSDALRELQSPLKARYREDPRAALITLTASGALDGEGIACSVETGKALVKAGLHPATGGDGAFACSGDMLLQALAACAGVTLKAVATALGVHIREGQVRVEGDLDFRGTLGVDKTAPVGFANIRLRFMLDTDADEATLESLLKLTERYCVVLQTLARPAALKASIARTGAA